MYIGMMDEDLHGVLLFLVETLRRMPGWTHQGILKQELLNAPIGGTLHRLLGSSSAEMFADFLKSFPNIFCINGNSNQLVQLCMKNGNVSEMTSTNFLVGDTKPEECIIGRGVSNMGGVRKQMELHSRLMEWNSVPETNGSKLGAFLNREPPVLSSTSVSSGIQSNYTRSSSTGNGGWDPIGSPLCDLQHGLLELGPTSSLSHLTNGWERSSMYENTRSDDYQPHYTWDGGSHSLSESLKNFTISNDNGYLASPPSLPSFGGLSDTTPNWISMSDNGVLDGLTTNSHASSVWDGPSLRCAKPHAPPLAPPLAQFGAQGTAATTYRAHDMINGPSNSSSSFKGWGEDDDDVTFSGFPIASPAKTSQQYYEWKCPPSPTDEPPALPVAEFSSPKDSLEEETSELESEPASISKASVSPLEGEQNEVDGKTSHILENTVEDTSPPQLKSATALSYAEALRSNTQRRHITSENGSTSSRSCVSNCASSTQSTLTTTSSQKSAGQTDKKCRRSLDGRCGKVESLNSTDGVLRLGSGKVYFDRNIFFDSGKPVSDLRFILKANDTVYFDATPDSNSHDWKATLAWIGKKPRSTSSSNPQATNNRATYRSLSEGHHPNASNGTRSAPKSAKEECSVEGNGEVVILFAHFGFIRRGKKFKENVHFNRNVFYASGNRVKELTDTLKEGSIVNYIAVPSDKKSCKWKANLVWTGPRPKV